MAAYTGSHSGMISVWKGLIAFLCIQFHYFQMLLENELKHNVVSKEDPFHVRVYIFESMFIVIENTLKIKIDKDPSTGVGIDNIRNRYMHLTGKNIVVKKGNGSILFLSKPFRRCTTILILSFRLKLNTILKLILL